MDIQEETRPIPAYYGCYLLRSTVRHSSLYIGSTPNPIRRLAQHNGTAKGGAKRTSRDSLRPWEMALVVEGFMSRVGALQFEWAWQHPERTRHIESDEEITRSKVIINSKTGKTKPRNSRSRRSLTAHLEDLHTLLRSTYFSSWPLRIRFFCADVHRVWRIWNDRVDVPLRDEKLILDGDCPGKASESEAVGSIDKLTVDYSKLETYLEKSMFLLDDAEGLTCHVCKVAVLPHVQQIVVCPREPCRSTNHLLCLSTVFLEVEGDPDSLIPTQGTCPACKETVPWPLMMQELSVRNRAEKEAQAILRRKDKRDRKNKTKDPRQTSVEPSSQQAGGVGE
ncbi:Structure-specific endonuclease subunit slx1 [Penicillium manginii]|uniref:Structure-specific endonuclease subunit slx1 n=1 Tax=Penicillium manginii TaxID=203109 RepID=UPI0025467E7E|nr:Structure-specific endonuclease subunit slx1 [Penicillium manginii]KAJ5741758.1 Structure-specific endonuclease subunit slx1 [Penicillium manginii]